MTREKLSKILDYWREGLISKNKALELIWGQPFDGETEKIKPTTEESSATGSEPLPNGTTYTRSYQVFLPTPTLKPTLIKSIFKSNQ